MFRRDWSDVDREPRGSFVALESCLESRQGIVFRIAEYRYSNFVAKKLRTLSETCIRICPQVKRCLSSSRGIMEKRYFFYSFKERKIQNKSFENIIDTKLYANSFTKYKAEDEFWLEKIISFIFILVSYFIFCTFSNTNIFVNSFFLRISYRYLMFFDTLWIFHSNPV